MTLFCLLSRPWRIPYSEHDPRGARGVFATLAWAHLRACPLCQTECARLRATGAALHHTARISPRRRDAVRDDLSSTLFAERVMTRVQRDAQMRRQIQLRHQRQWTATVSLSLVLAGLGFAFTVYGPPSLARTWFTKTFPAAHPSVRTVSAKKPPFPMHDPFGVAEISARPKSVPRMPSVPSASRERTPVLFAQTQALRPPVGVASNPLPSPTSPSAVDEAREATIVAEEAERARWDKARAIIVPSPNGARLAAAGTAPARIAAQSAPPLLLANAETNQGANSVRPKMTPTSYDAMTDRAAAGNRATNTSDKPASPDDLRSLGLAPSTPPNAPSPPSELGAPVPGTNP